MARVFIPRTFRPKLSRVSPQKWTVTILGTTVSQPRPYGSANATRKAWYRILRRMSLDNPPSTFQLRTVLSNFIGAATNPGFGFVPIWTTGP